MVVDPRSVGCSADQVCAILARFDIFVPLFAHFFELCTDSVAVIRDFMRVIVDFWRCISATGRYMENGCHDDELDSGLRFYDVLLLTVYASFPYFIAGFPVCGTTGWG